MEATEVKPKINKTNDKDYFKKYYQLNKDTILDSIKTQVTCECGLQVTKGHISRHMKTKIHTKNMKKQTKKN